MSKEQDNIRKVWEEAMRKEINTSLEKMTAALYSNSNGVMLGYDPGYIREFYTQSDCKPVVCECGAEKANTTHSTWCPKESK